MNAFLLIMIGVPVLGHACSIFAYIWYPINRETYERMYAEMPEHEEATSEVKAESNQAS